MLSAAPHRRAPFPVTALAAVALLSGCSGDGARPAGAAAEPAVPAIPTIAEATTLRFPLDAFEATDEQNRTLARAQGILTSRCMARFGFRYQAPQNSSPQQPRGGSRRFGVTDLKTASQYGYRNPRTAGSEPPRDTGRGTLSRTAEIVLLGEPGLKPEDLPASQQEAESEGGSATEANGKRIPFGGCTRESFLKLYAPKPGTVDLLYVFNLRNQADSEYRGDSRVRAVDRRWSDCMAESGYRTRDPHNAAEELGLGEARSGPEAISAAKADVLCKHRVNLVGVHYAVLSAYEQRAVERNAETLKLAKDQLDERLRLAAGLTG
ncbi:hypothetical protein [Streptomyces sp. CC208A]|uniref:hypothetical protein n=1 Tax=Streptomyces sp. CC208A TaxID=3044573 RepID=UPI0024A93F3A|nr:hypothetical protein [Streptomyces sp. CC208A]